MKLVKIISEYNAKKHPGKGGMVEAIVKLKDGSLVTRHIHSADAADADKAEATPEQA